MRKILFRVDASVVMGYGHILRCISLANYCIERSIPCLFILKDSDEKVEAILQNNDLAYKIIRDESDILKIDEDQPGRIVVLDVNNPVLFKKGNDYSSYISLLKQNSFTVVAFEEMTEDVFPSNLVIIPYVGADVTKHGDTADTKYLLGPSFFVFREEFLNAPKFIINDTVKDIFICMGGSDPDMLTEKILAWIAAYPLGFNLNIVFARLSDVRKTTIEKILQGYKGAYQIHVDPSFISSIIASSDMGIINSGLIKYETSVLGLPCITVSNEMAHEPIMKLFGENESIYHLGLAGQVSEKLLHEAISCMTGDSNRRKIMSQKCITMFDGKGKERIYANLLQLKIN